MRDLSLSFEPSTRTRSNGARGRLHKRLWIAGVIWAATVTAIVAMSVLALRAEPDGPRSFGHDFLPSYAAGRIVRDGHPELLYDPDAVQAVERAVAQRFNLATDGRFGPFLNPPVFALLFVPLAKLPYPQAAAAWMVAGWTLLAASLVLLCRMLPPHAEVDVDTVAGRFGWRRWGLIPLFVLTSLPFWQAFCHQQNTFLSLALLCTAVACWRAGRPFCAGLAAGLLFLKPQLGLALAVVLILLAGRRALAGIVTVGLTLLLLNLIVLPGTLGAYLSGLSPILYDLQFRQAFNWSRQITPHSFWRLLLQGRGTGETIIAARVLAGMTSLGFAGALLAVVLRARREARRALTGDIAASTRDRLIAATVSAMPLLMPYYMDYDLLLLAVPAVLFAGEKLGQNVPSRDDRLDRRLLSAWVTLYVCNVAFGLVPDLQTRFHLTVPLLAAVAIGQIRRAARFARVEASLPAKTESSLTLPPAIAA